MRQWLLNLYIWWRTHNDPNALPCGCYENMTPCGKDGHVR